MSDEALPQGVIMFNGGIQCDMRTGPCSCGATHRNEEWNHRVNKAKAGLL